ncbi:MAG: alpha-2-macroglobulin [Magnetococcales bacterium]|nr:alpha-2-macroglobulin [Magnetococcales bacterium]
MAKAVRQVVVRFSQPMVALGSPSHAAPFVVECPEPGQGGWSDNRNWTYTFDRILPAGLSCTFTQRPGLQSLNGTPVVGEGRYTLSTGGPAIIFSLPDDRRSISEEQLFVLGLNAPVDWSSVPENIYCDIEGIGEKVKMRLLTGQERLEALRQASPSLLEGYPGLLNLYFKGKFDRGWGEMYGDRLPKQGSYLDKLLALLDWQDSPILVAQCQRPLPKGAKVGVVWGKGIRSTAGVGRIQPQRLNYNVRAPFSATVQCTRHNKNAQCVPILPIQLEFSEAIPWTAARQIRLQGPDGTLYPSRVDQEEVPESDGSVPPPKVHALSFPGPFPAESTFTIEIPADAHGEEGGQQIDREPITLSVKTDRIPSLAKFAGDFGLIEANGEAMLPVTVRDLEAILPLDADDPGSAEPEAGGVVDNWAVDGQPVQVSAEADAPVELRGRRLRVETPVAFLEWIEQVHAAKRGHSGEASEGTPAVRPGESSLFAHLQPDDESLETFVLPKPGGKKAFEVLGIPFQKPGFYVVELASDRLGAELHGDNKRYFAQAAVVVTNLSPHFKRGRQHSLVWVTSLDQGKPVANAEVTVSDCHGKLFFSGRTDSQGVATIAQPLPPDRTLPQCPLHRYSGYLVTVRAGDDSSFLLSSWDEGISPFDFNLPFNDDKAPAALFGTVLDRSLLRAGESLSMKHFARHSSEAGLRYPTTAQLPRKGIIRHSGSGQQYEFALDWNELYSAENHWQLPKEARLGHYQVLLPIPDSAPVQEVVSAQFWVEAFRMPTLRASIQPVQPEAIAPAQMAFDLQLSPLSGGSVGAVPVKLRGVLRPITLKFDGYDAFEFANGRVKEGMREAPTNPWEASASAPGDGQRSEASAQPVRTLPVQSLTLNPAGLMRAVIPGLEGSDTPQELRAELEYQDSNGERLTSSSRLTWLPSQVVLGVNLERWASNAGELQLHVVALDRHGQPLAQVPVTVNLLEHKYLSHRKRLIGGFYAYEHRLQVKPVSEFCSGMTDKMGRLLCTGQSPLSGQIILQARAVDAQQRASYAHVSAWVAKDKRWWFDVENNNRMDLLPEKNQYEPGEEAVLHVRMPFPEATVLVTVEREGVVEHFIRTLQGHDPTLRIPMQGRYAPNVFISAMAVRGRTTDVAPTAMLDLGKPTFRLGYTQLKVGWREHALQVRVNTDRPVYKVRESALATIRVTPPDGQTLPKNAELAMAVVDEGLLELRANDSWNLLASMMQPRAFHVTTATAMGRVIGRRHYGLKSVSHGGGGGRMPAGRQLLKPLLLWQGRVKLNDKGEAQVPIPLQDALSSFRVVAVASAGESLFGSGFTSFRTAQELAIHAGLPPLVREQDRFRAGFTLRNGGERPLQVTVNATLTAQPRRASDPPPPRATLSPITQTLAPGEGQEIAWEVTVPDNSQSLQWEIHAAAEGAEDRLLVKQAVQPAQRVQVIQSTLSALDQPQEILVERPPAALADQGGIRVQLQERLAGTLDGVRAYMSDYPYSCLEQRVSKAVALQEKTAWQPLMESLPAFLDADGLAKYFPSSAQGSDVLTAYVLAIAHETGWSVPADLRQKMVKGLFSFVKGTLQRPEVPSRPVAGLMLRKLAALEALSRYEAIPSELLTSIPVEPDLWPASALLDWINLLNRVAWPERVALGQKAREQLRSRLSLQGSTMGLTSRESDALWWMMVSEESNANRMLLTLLQDKSWAEDMPRLARGALARQVKGHWSTSTANAWGVVAMQKFSEHFEKIPVSGESRAQLAGQVQRQDWTRNPQGGTLDLPWPSGPEKLSLLHQGLGRPWLTVQSRAAIPLTKPLFSGYRIQRSLLPIERKVEGVWSRGDLLRVRLEMEAQTDMSWVVVNDPIPAGSTILGSGSGKDSWILTQGEGSAAGSKPTFEERGFDAFRAYYEWLPKGRWQLEYTLRLNNPGQFRLPSTRVEAMYAPELFGESPLESLTVLP